MTRPVAVLLDAGGVLLLPEHDRILGAFSRAECAVPAALLDRAHYLAASRFTTDLDVERDWQGCWQRYLDAYIDACGVADTVLLSIGELVTRFDPDPVSTDPVDTPDDPLVSLLRPSHAPAEPQRAPARPRARLARAEEAAS